MRSLFGRRDGRDTREAYHAMRRPSHQSPHRLKLKILNFSGDIQSAVGRWLDWRDWRDAQIRLDLLCLKMQDLPCKSLFSHNCTVRPWTASSLWLKFMLWLVMVCWSWTHTHNILMMLFWRKKKKQTHLCVWFSLWKIQVNRCTLLSLMLHLLLQSFTFLPPRSLLDLFSCLAFLCTQQPLMHSLAPSATPCSSPCLC